MTEVSYLNMIVACQKDVEHLQVAVDDATAMEIFDSRDNLGDPANDGEEVEPEHWAVCVGVYG
jgi:hypothetical protein